MWWLRVIVGLSLLVFQSSLFAQSLAIPEAQKKLAPQFSGFFKPYKDLSFDLARIFLSPQPDLKKAEELIFREVHLRSWTSMVPFIDSTWNIDLENSWNFYIAQDVKSEKSFLNIILSHKGKTLGSVSLSFSREGILQKANFEYWLGVDRREKSLSFDSSASLIDADFFIDQEVRSWEKIYGRDISNEIPSRRIKVGLIDSGVDYNHPAIAKNIPRIQKLDGSWGILGKDFKNGDDLAFDTLDDSLDHGTSVAGVLIEGASFIEIVPVVNRSENLEESVRFLFDQGVRIINLSQEISQNLLPDIKLREEQDWIRTIQRFPEILFVLAAGNDGKDVVAERILPQGAAFPNLLVVGALNWKGDRAEYIWGGSNYNRDRVQVVAIGDDVWAPVPGNLYDCTGGTSFAAPQIARLAARFLLDHPTWDPAQIIRAIEADSGTAENLTGVFKFGKPPRSLGVDSVKRCEAAH